MTAKNQNRQKLLPVVTQTSFIFKQNETVYWVQSYLNEQNWAAAALHVCGLALSEHKSSKVSTSESNTSHGSGDKHISTFCAVVSTVNDDQTLGPLP